MPTEVTYNETELVRQLKEKDARAFGYLYDHYSPAIYGVILRIINEEELAHDILQDVFVKIWKSIQQYDATKGKLFTWMLNIARNTSIDTLRSKTYKFDRKIQELGNNVNSVDSNLSVSPKVDHLGLNKVLATLKTEQRTIIDLAYFKGYTQEEISKELDIPLGTVKTRIRNALIQLRGLLNK